MLVRLFPLIFVFVWASAFVSSKFIVEDATPFAALCFRFAIVAAGYALYVRYIGGALLGYGAEAGKAMAIGVLFHGFYLGGVFYAVAQGMPTGMVALIVTLQPVLTAVLAPPLLGEKVSAKQWLGLVLGFSGVAIVLRVDLSTDLVAGAYWAAVVGLLSITFGTLWQKKQSNNLPLAVSNMYQALSATLFHGAVVLLLERSPRIEFTLQFALSMGWQIVLVSFGAFTILTYLIKHGSASKAAALFFLVPGVSVVIAWAIADETLSPTSIVGLLISSAGVYIATRQKKES